VRLGPEASRRGYRIASYEVLGSTSDEALSRARAGEAGGKTGGLWIVAGEQTAGRGRLGRPWASPHGNLHASLLLVDPTTPRLAPQLGFVAGIALIDALQASAPSAPVQLKWPNDVLSGGAKLAGVLVEGATLSSGQFAACIGFGVDCAHNPTGLAYPATNLAALGINCTPERLLEALAESCAHWLDIWAAGAGFSNIRAQWLAHAASLGAPIRVGRGDHVLEGVFETIDDDGRLILATPSGRTALEAGELFPSGVALTNG
jgi:BirA family biotin operon repressor/biotin-[acetyl-CoA-carboxylase] ligase